jgi:parallel beta-helix repeat protein
MNTIILRKHFATILLAFAATLLFAASSASASQNVTTCGATISKAGTYILAADLDCSGTDATGINITGSNVTFHLAGHTLSSTDCSDTKEVYGIFVVGKLTNVRIDGGKVQGFTDGVVLSSSHSRVRGVTVTSACLFGIAITGSNNQVDTSVVSLTHGDGIGIGSGGGNRILSNDISDNFRVGVDISNFSNNNVVQNNIISNNGIAAQQQGGVAIFNGTGNLIANNALNNNFEGIEIESPGNAVSGNVVSGSADVGIFLPSLGSPSTVQNNIVFGSALVDMLDDQAACGSNTWRSNNFQTDLVNDIPDGGPKVGCLR